MASSDSWRACRSRRRSQHEREDRSAGARASVKLYCRHADCRAHAAEELMFIAARIRRPELIPTARMLIRKAPRVRCRHVPRRGPINVPLPENTNVE
jgi:hypothetical protein